MIDAGVPLEMGLRSSASGARPPLAAAFQHLADRLDRGVPLDVAISEETSLPETWRAVIVAGLRSGRTSEALAELSQTTSTLQTLQRSIALQFVYPTFVFGVATVLTIVGIHYWIPVLVDFYIDTHRAPPGLLSWMSQHATGIGLFVGVMGAGLIGLTLSTSFGRRGIPGFGRLFSDLQTAQVSRLLALLLRNQVPLPEALRLTAGTVKAPTWRTALQEMATRAEQGESLSTTVMKQRGVPRFFQWVVTAGIEDSSLDTALQQAADVYQHRAWGRGEWMRRIFPTVITLVVGGAVVLLYTVSVFAPMTQIWEELARPDVVKSTPR